MIRDRKPDGSQPPHHGGMIMEGSDTQYPVSLDIDYPDQADKLTTFFRLLTVVPILVILGLLIGGGWEFEATDHWSRAYSGGGVVFIPTLLMIVVMQKYPRWWFDWNLELTRFSGRVVSYLLLLTHRYPSTDESQGVHIEIAYPDVKNDLQRGMPLVKWILILPHVIVLYFLYVAVFVCTFIGWFAILFTGAYPRALFDFVVGVMRWSLRVFSYAILLTTDEYPPFQLNG